MKKNIFNIVQLLIDDLVDIHGVNAISLVGEPAIERDFVHFHKEYMTDFKQLDGEQRKVVGPLLIPNKMILRKQGDEYFYVYFDEATIRETAERFQKNSYQNNGTLEHDSKLENITFIETWIKESDEHDKSALYGFEDLPIGTWFGMAKINDDETWEKIKDGTVKGFSIEGRYTDALLAASAEEVEVIGTPEEQKLYDDICKLIEDFYNEHPE